ncbi:MAG TPA: dihydroorotate dehydrogenase electron transfer subunit [Solirubrobacteraceae bacterium]|jgi:dihydroorotate dehydrogenase electron transfer subunit|nr:dihydroorotate dehydrogenase electron transfer subunit [Solirubrobacteraceae bacterium]
MTTDVSPAGSGRALAPFGRRLLTVTANETLGAYCVLKAADPYGPEPAAGQFAMLAAAERWGAGEEERPYVPRAFSYARFQDGEAHFLLEDVGPGTRRLCELEEGDGLWLLGPLGQGFTAPEQGRRALLVGGGVGIAPLAIWQDELKGKPHADDVSQTSVGLRSDRPLATLLGFRDSAHSEGATLLEDAVLASDDGSVGHHGRVTELLRAELDRDAQATVYACGPPPMLEAVRALCTERDVPAQLALEAGMACGFGACYGCVVPARAGYLRVCVDGPVVDGAALEQVSDHMGAPG